MQPRSWPVLGVLTLGACGGVGARATLDALDASVEAANVPDSPISEIPDAPVAKVPAEVPDADGSSGWCSPLSFFTSTQDASADGGTGRCVLG